MAALKRYSIGVAGLFTIWLLAAFLLVVVTDLRRARLFDDKPQRFSLRPRSSREDE